MSALVLRECLFSWRGPGSGSHQQLGELPEQWGTLEDSRMSDGYNLVRQRGARASCGVYLLQVQTVCFRLWGKYLTTVHFREQTRAARPSNNLACPALRLSVLE